MTSQTKHTSTEAAAYGSWRASDAGDKSRPHRRSSHSDPRTSHARPSAHGSVASSRHETKDKEKESHRSHKESSSSHSTVRPEGRTVARNDYNSYVTNARGGGRTTQHDEGTRHARPSFAVKDSRRESTAHRDYSGRGTMSHLSKPSRSHSVKESSHRDSRPVKDSHRDPYDSVRTKSKTAFANDRSSTSTVKRSASARTSTRQTKGFDDYESMITSKGRKALMTRESTCKTDRGMESLMTSMGSKAVPRCDHSRNAFRATSSRAPTTKPSNFASTIKPTGEVGTYRSSAAVGGFGGSSSALHGTGITHHGQSGTYANSGALVPYDRDSQTLQPSGTGSSAWPMTDRSATAGALAPALAGAHIGHAPAHAGHFCGGPHMYMHYGCHPPLGFWGFWGMWGMQGAFWRCRTWSEYWIIKPRYIHGVEPPPQPPFPYEEIDVVRATAALDAGRYADNPADALYEAAEERLGYCPCPHC